MFEDLEYKVNNHNLDLHQQKRFTSFFTMLLTKYRLKLIFRGERFSNLKHKLNISENADINSFSDKIFLIGEKAKIYYKEEIFKLSNQKNIFAINSTEDELFIYVFNKFKKIFKSNNLHQELLNFKNENEIFENYFLDTRNKKIFLEEINRVETKSDKLKIRDYYISILHRIGKIGIQNKSFFLSTTTDFRIAKEFSNLTNRLDSIILIGWTNKRRQNQWTTHRKPYNEKTELVKKYNLPTINPMIYKYQKEISMKGGILPHYLVGYILPNENELHINPELFNTSNSFEDIISNGFDIDQSEFENELMKTNYKGYFTLFENGELLDEYPAHNKR